MTTDDTTIGLVGTLTDDPELRFSAKGKPWAKARISVQPWAPAATEKPEAVFYDVVAFGSLAENLAETCHKGARVAVAGRFEEERWTGRDGVERTAMKVVADGIGPDLRFTMATITRTERRGPSEPSEPEAPATGISAILGPQRPAGYSEEPF